MGDRGNIKVGGVYLYTHWGGSNIKAVLVNALKRKQRWDDEAYLTKIILNEMIEDVGGDIADEVGFGITTEICDNEYPILEVDVKNQVIWCDGECWTFKEFIGEIE